MRARDSPHVGNARPHGAAGSRRGGCRRRRRRCEWRWCRWRCWWRWWQDEGCVHARALPCSVGQVHRVPQRRAQPGHAAGGGVARRAAAAGDGRGGCWLARVQPLRLARRLHDGRVRCVCRGVAAQRCGGGQPGGGGQPAGLGARRLCAVLHGAGVLLLPLLARHLCCVCRQQPRVYCRHHPVCARASGRGRQRGERVGHAH